MHGLVTNRRRRRTEAPSWGRMLRKMRAARLAETDLCHYWRGGHSEFGLCTNTSFESLCPQRTLRRDASREQANPSSLMGDRKFRSDPCVTGALEA